MYKNTIHQVFTLIITLADAQVIIKVLDHEYQWLAGGYDLEILPGG